MAHRDAYRQVDGQTFSVILHGQARQPNIDDDRRNNCQLGLTDDGPIYHIGRPPLSSSMITRCGDRRAVAKVFKSRVWDEVLEGNALILDKVIC